MELTDFQVIYKLQKDACVEESGFEKNIKYMHDYLK